jgi:hypothetical protein
LGLLGMLLGLTLVAFWVDRRASISVSRSDALMVVIRQEGDQVTFEAHEGVGRLWSTPGVTRAVSTLLVTTRRDQRGESALWQVEAVTPHTGPITYGRVPEGFAQMIPGTGPPPALRVDDKYDVLVVGPAGRGLTRFNFRTAVRD